MIWMIVLRQMRRVLDDINSQAWLAADNVCKIGEKLDLRKTISRLLGVGRPELPPEAPQSHGGSSFFCGADILISIIMRVIQAWEGDNYRNNYHA